MTKIQISHTTFQADGFAKTNRSTTKTVKMNRRNHTKNKTRRFTVFGEPLKKIFFPSTNYGSLMHSYTIYSTNAATFPRFSKSVYQFQENLSILGVGVFFSIGEGCPPDLSSSPTSYNTTITKNGREFAFASTFLATLT